MTEKNEREILLEAIAVLESDERFGPGATPLVIRTLKDTANEYEPDTRVLCSHCWDNVNFARIIIGLEPNYMVEDDDEVVG